MSECLPAQGDITELRFDPTEWPFLSDLAAKKPQSLVVRSDFPTRGVNPMRAFETALPAIYVEAVTRTVQEGGTDKDVYFIRSLFCGIECYQQAKTGHLIVLFLSRYKWRNMPVGGRGEYGVGTVLARELHALLPSLDCEWVLRDPPYVRLRLSTLEDLYAFQDHAVRFMRFYGAPYAQASHTESLVLAKLWAAFTLEAKRDHKPLRTESFSHELIETALRMRFLGDTTFAFAFPRSPLASIHRSLDTDTLEFSFHFRDRGLGDFRFSLDAADEEKWRDEEGAVSILNKRISALSEAKRRIDDLKKLETHQGEVNAMIRDLSGRIPQTAELKDAIENLTIELQEIETIVDVVINHRGSIDDFMDDPRYSPRLKRRVRLDIESQSLWLQEGGTAGLELLRDEEKRRLTELNKVRAQGKSLRLQDMLVSLLSQSASNDLRAISMLKGIMIQENQITLQLPVVRPGPPPAAPDPQFPTAVSLLVTALLRMARTTGLSDSIVQSIILHFARAMLRSPPGGIHELPGDFVNLDDEDEKVGEIWRSPRVVGGDYDDVVPGVSDEDAYNQRIKWLSGFVDARVVLREGISHRYDDLGTPFVLEGLRFIGLSERLPAGVNLLSTRMASAGTANGLYKQLFRGQMIVLNTALPLFEAAAGWQDHTDRLHFAVWVRVNDPTFKAWWPSRNQAHWDSTLEITDSSTLGEEDDEDTIGMIRSVDGGLGPVELVDWPFHYSIFDNFTINQLSVNLAIAVFFGAWVERDEYLGQVQPWAVSQSYDIDYIFGNLSDEKVNAYLSQRLLGDNVIIAWRYRPFSQIRFGQIATPDEEDVLADMVIECVRAPTFDSLGKQVSVDVSLPALEVAPSLSHAEPAHLEHLAQFANSDDDEMLEISLGKIGSDVFTNRYATSMGCFYTFYLMFGLSEAEKRFACYFLLSRYGPVVGATMPVLGVLPTTTLGPADLRLLDRKAVSTKRDRDHTRSSRPRIRKQLLDAYFVRSPSVALEGKEEVKLGESKRVGEKSEDKRASREHSGDTGRRTRKKKEAEIDEFDNLTDWRLHLRPITASECEKMFDYLKVEAEEISEEEEVSEEEEDEEEEES